jgi:excisionase family DNA binding protein
MAETTHAASARGRILYTFAELEAPTSEGGTGLSGPTLRKEVASGRLPSVLVGRRRLFRAEDVAEWLSARRVAVPKIAAKRAWETAAA